MKRIALLLLLVLAVVPAVHASPASPNNKFGISLLQPTESDIKDAAALINSQGGDWGYVTLVIQENDRDHGKWQGLFDELRRKHLIPIVRVATRPEGENWARPRIAEAKEWVRFLDSLNWVVKERYIVLFNEPNHATEWGGGVDPDGFAHISASYAKAFKERNGDYFVMLAGFDAAAPSYPDTYEDEEVFLRKALEAQPDLFKHIDGWSSHSYPNPAFSGSPADTGRRSIRGYEWELSLLQSLGITKPLPVFITETGWVDERLSRETIASYYETAYRQIWQPDNRVVAVTPFVLSYQSPPFLGFSWKYPSGSSDYYPQYKAVAALEKTRGYPLITEKGRVLQELPAEFVASSNYRFSFLLKNEGQAIWDKDQGYELAFESGERVPFEYFFSDIKNLEPLRETEVSLYIKTHNIAGEHNVKIALKKDGETIARTGDWRFVILPLPRLDLSVSLYPKIKSNGTDFEVQIYDEQEELVYKRSGIKIESGKGAVEEVQNIVFGRTYRVVLLRPYYLPRQSFVTFSKNGNSARFKRLLPFDFNKDGKMGFDDMGALFSQPHLFRLLAP